MKLGGAKSSLMSCHLLEITVLTSLGEPLALCVKHWILAPHSSKS